MSHEINNNKNFVQIPPVLVPSKGPMSLLNLTAAYVVTNDFQNSPDVVIDSDSLSTINEVIKKRWDELKNSKLITQDLKESMIEIEKTIQDDDLFNTILNDNPTLWPELKLSYGIHPENSEYQQCSVENMANSLFQKLAQKCNTQAFYGNTIPVDASSYVHMQQELDHALLVVWKDIYRNYPTLRYQHRVPKLKTANEIRDWLAIDTNKKKLECVESLKLESKKLKVIPPEIMLLTKLEVLDLSFNQITSIPKELANNSKLRVLNLEGNQITSIPKELGHSELADLNLINNRIKSIPKELGNSQITSLRLGKNQIKSIPKELGNSKLTVLDLSSNQINFIPIELANSPLDCLALSNNQINFIPKELANSQLKSLSVENNKITSIPKELASSKVRFFFLGKNQITSIPKEFSNLQLEWLDLKDNQISVIPHELIKETGYKICVDENPLLFISDKVNHSTLFEKSLTQHHFSVFEKYECKSMLSKFLQSITCETNDREKIEDDFCFLDYADQLLIYEMVSIESGIKFSDAQWDEQHVHVFEDMDRFYRALRKSISVKFDRMSQEDKEKVYNEAYLTVKPIKFEKESMEYWVQKNGFKNVLRMIDIMYGAGF